MTRDADNPGYRVSPQQRRLHLLWESASDLRTLALVEIRGELDPERFKRSFELLTRRHDILRTLFVKTPGVKVPFQVVASAEKKSESLTTWCHLGRESESRLASFSSPTELLDWNLRHSGEGNGIRATLSAIPEAVRSNAEESDRQWLLLDLPALSADWRSLACLVEELAHIYRHESPPLEEVLQYIHFSEWQNELLEENDGEHEYWRVRRSEMGTCQRLPFAVAAAAPGAAEVRSHSRRLDADVVGGLENLAGELAVDESTVWLACWMTLLFRSLDRSAITLGCGFEGRHYEEFEGALGIFARFLPIHGRLGDELLFSDLARELHSQIEGAAQWQEYFIRDAGDAGEPSAWELGFDFRVRPPRQAAEPGEVVFELLGEHCLIDRFEILLVGRKSGAELEAVLHYDGDLYRAADIADLAARLETLAAEVARRGGARQLGEYEVACTADHLALSALNAGERSYPEHTVIELFARQVERDPRAPALVDQATRLDYGELARRSGRLARVLRRRGVRPEALVGIYLERSADLVVAILAILEAGGAYLPLDPSHPRGRLEAVLGDARPDLILTDKDHAAELLAGPVPVVSTEEAASPGDLPAGRETRAPSSVNPRPGNLCYVLYTSGSTGRPKGVMVSHGAVANYLQWSADRYPWSEGRGSPVPSPIGFDLTVTSLLGPLVSGRTAILIREERGLEGLAEELCSGEALSLVKLTPAHLAIVAQLLPDGDALVPPAAFIVGGEALRAEMLEPWQHLAPGLRVVNEYGPTEATVGCAVHELRLAAGADSGPGGDIPIGRPVADARLFPTQRHLRLVPTGTPGELLVGGAGLARGYLGQPRETAQRFVPDPFDPLPGARLYRTGDRVRQRSDGELEYLDRIDHQVKIRGYRIEPGEIEAHLLEHPQIRAGVVVARDDLPQGRDLVAYLVEEGGGAPSARDLCLWLGRRLPDYMVPAEFVFLDDFPLTANGKIDRRALPAPSGARSVEYVRPASVCEMQIARIWEKLLGKEPIGVTENFFQIGGHSLLGVQLVAQIRQQMARELPLTVLMAEDPTIRRLARFLDADESAAPWSPLVEMQPGIREERPFFLLPTQGGQTFCYLDLVRHLDDRWPVYGLQAPGRDDGGQPLTSLEEMAAFFWDVIRTVQRRGPYRLGGWSNGGVLAFEMARQMRGSGEEVELLALLDPDLRHRTGPASNAEFLVEIAGADLSITLEDLGDREEVDDLLAFAMQRVEEMDPSVSASLDLQELRRLFTFYKKAEEARQSYLPRPCPGRAHYFMSQPKIDEGVEDPSLCAADLMMEGLEIHVLPAHHIDFVAEPNAQRLAVLIGSMIRSLEPRSPKAEDTSTRKLVPTEVS